MAHRQCQCLRVVIIPLIILASDYIKQVLSVRTSEAVKQTNAAVINVDDAVPFLTVSQTCIYGQEKCCCEEYTCKKFLTGQFKGEDACNCQDEAAIKLLGFSGVEPKSSEQEEVCAGINTTEGGTQEPKGSCSLDRLHELESPKKKSCKQNVLEKLEPLQRKLDKSKLLNFDNRITGGAIMGCAAIDEACASAQAQGWSWSSLSLSAITTSSKRWLVDRGAGVLTSGQQRVARWVVYAGLMKVGLSWADSRVLTKWALTHGPAKNPFCKDDANDPEYYMGMLHRVLMTNNNGSRNMSHYIINGTQWSDALKATIRNMLVVNCVDTAKPMHETLKTNGQGVVIDDLNLRSSQWREHEWLKTLLEYVKKPLVNRTIDDNRANLIRNITLIMDKLLVENKINSTMPPELEGMWRRLSTATHGKQLWDDVKFNFSDNDAKPRCQCDDIEESLAVHLLNLMPQLGLDFGKLTWDESSGKLATDKTPVPPSLQYLDKKELRESVHRMAMSEAGLWDPEFGVKYLAQTLKSQLFHSDESVEEDSSDDDVEEDASDDEPPSPGLPWSMIEAEADDDFIPGVGHQAMVKGVLVGLPVLQNMMAVSDKPDENGKVAFAKKMEWFFVMNIMWAVNYALDNKMSAMDIVLGLATTLLSLLNSFAEGDARLLQMTGDLSFVEFQLAVYTVWNFRFAMEVSEQNPDIYWMHGAQALSMPLLQSIANHGNVRHWFNYRRDDLFHTMLAHMKKHLAITKKEADEKAAQEQAAAASVK